jgi:hypothetical protein
VTPGGAAAAQEEVKRLAKDNAAALSKQDDAVDAAEKLLRKGTAESVDKAISDLDAADRALGSESLSNKALKERIKDAKGSALARRALIAIDARDMTRAASLVAEYAELKGEDDPAVVRLQKELNAKRNDPTFRNIDELSRASVARTTRSTSSSSRDAPVTSTATTEEPSTPTAKSSSTSPTTPSPRPTRSASARCCPTTPASGTAA